MLKLQAKRDWWQHLMMPKVPTLCKIPWNNLIFRLKKASQSLIIHHQKLAAMGLILTKLLTRYSIIGHRLKCSLRNLRPKLRRGWRQKTLRSKHSLERSICKECLRKDNNTVTYMVSSQNTKQHWKNWRIRRRTSKTKGSI